MDVRMKRFCYFLQVAKLDFKQYQYDGVQWCLHNELEPAVVPNAVARVRGGLIVDEMGLGKTIMMIGTIFAHLVPRTLIVLPPILIQQWYKEIYRTSGHKALIFYGQGKQKITKEMLENSRIVLTSYNHVVYLKKNTEMVTNVLHTILWDRVIFDEAHHLRNKKTSRFLGCSALKTSIRWFVTGTPIQNKINDFYSLCSALGMPAEFYRNDTGLVFIRDHFVLKRSKADVGIALEAVQETNAVVPWATLEEKIMSEEIHSSVRMCGVSDQRSGLFSKQLTSPLIAILRAKQCCIMPTLMSHNIQELVTKGDLDSSYLNKTKHGISKIQAVLHTLLRRKLNGKGKIVFCHYRAEIDYLATKLKENGMSVAIFDGRSHGKRKMKQISEKYDVLILQIQTGCEGLNLQENYSEVYFVSPHWNPSIEDQAVARCHRIGQKQVVEVFKFTMTDFDDEGITLESYIRKVQGIKRQVRDKILG